MSWARVAAARVQGLFARSRVSRDLDEELRFHVDMQTADNIAAGMDAQQARWAALRSFGAMEPMKETYRERASVALLDAAARDVRYAARTLRRSPGFTITSVLVLALAIGSNTAMFSIVNATLLRPLPYPSPEQLVMLWTSRPSHNVREGRSAYWNVEAWRRDSRSFVAMAVFDGVSVTIDAAGGAEQVSAARVSPEFFPLLGVRAAQGRLFSVEDGEGRQRVAVISDRFWQVRFGRSPAAVGATVDIDGSPIQVIGVLPSGFEVPGMNADVWEPHTLFPDWEARRRVRGTDSWLVLARLQPNVTIEQAQAEMTALERRLDDELPAADRDLGVTVAPLMSRVAGPKARLALWMLAAAVLCVLLVAATNIASLSLARAASRAHEVAIRSALGASGATILRQLLAESLTLALVSGALGLGIAAAMIRAVVRFRPGNLARLDQAHLDPPVIAWSLALCLMTGVLVGIAPAMSMIRRKREDSLRESGRSIAGGVGAGRLRQALVIAEFAIAIVLLVGAGLLVRSLWSIERVDPGFNPDRVLAVAVSSPATGGSGHRSGFYDRVLEQVQSLPGVESVGVIGDFFIGSNLEQVLTTEGNAALERLRVRRDEVSPGLFRTAGARLLRGRFFSAADGPEAPRVAIVNDAVWRRLWPGRDPIGQRISLGRDTERTWFTVVGVVSDMRRQGLETEPIPQVFEPLAQAASRHESMLVRTTAADPLLMAPSVQAAVHRMDRHAVVYHVSTVDERLGNLLAERRFQTWLLIGFSGFALLMAAIGIYGLIRYSIATRTHEIGIRMAVGAQAGEIFRMVMREGLTLSMAGLVVGACGAAALSRAASSLLYGVTAGDPATYAAVSVLLVTATAMACYFPARRAGRLDPIVALRRE